MIHSLQTDPDLDALSTALDGASLDKWDYVVAGCIVAGAFALSRVAKFVLAKAMERSGADEFISQLLGRLLGYLVVVLGLVYALDRLGIAAGPAIGALGIVGIALAFALQDMLENFVAGVLIQLRRPFTAGQEVVLADIEGTVTEIDARAVVVNTPDGERVRIPSSSVIKSPIVNHSTLGLRRTDVVVGVAYGTDLRRARTVAGAAAEQVQLVDDSRPVEVLVTEFGDSSINLIVRYWHEPSIRGRWHAQNDVAIAIDEAFTEAGIEIPFPQRVLTINPTPAEAD